MNTTERYRNDAQFKMLVDSLLHQIRLARYTPTEIREAAMMAQIIFEQENPRPIMVMPQPEPGESIEAFRKRFPF